MNNELGNKIKAWRKQKKLTQEEFAFKIGRSTEAVSMIERGINNPSPDTIDAISKILGVPKYEFYKTSSDNSKDKRQQMIDKSTGILYNFDDKNLRIALKILEALNDAK
jgi:transcriptional regulator with XRE-family HTH domain